MAYLIISLLTIAQLAAIIIFLNNLVQIFVSMKFASACEFD